MHHSKEQNILYGLYNDETELLHAIHEAHDRHLNVKDVFTPFPVHGLDKAMGLEESRLHIAGFVYGLTGGSLIFSFMTWIFTKDWPLIFGGKPLFSFPAFIPEMFEMTILSAAIGMTVTFYTICGMGPGVINPVLDERITDDKFCIAFDADGGGDVNAMRKFFTDTHAAEVHVKKMPVKY